MSGEKRENETEQGGNTLTCGSPAPFISWISLLAEKCWFSRPTHHIQMACSLPKEQLSSGFKVPRQQAKVLQDIPQVFRASELDRATTALKQLIALAGTEPEWVSSKPHTAVGPGPHYHPGTVQSLHLFREQTSVSIWQRQVPSVHFHLQECWLVRVGTSKKVLTWSRSGRSL